MVQLECLEHSDQDDETAVFLVIKEKLIRKEYLFN